MARKDFFVQFWYARIEPVFYAGCGGIPVKSLLENAKREMQELSGRPARGRVINMGPNVENKLTVLMFQSEGTKAAIQISAFRKVTFTLSTCALLKKEQIHPSCRLGHWLLSVVIEAIYENEKYHHNNLIKRECHIRKFVTVIWIISKSTCNLGT